MEAKLESQIRKEIMLALGSRRDVRIWNNNTGRLIDSTGRQVSYGLCVGSSDLIGILSDGRFLALEVKRPGGKPTNEQVVFLEIIKKFGGVAGIVTSVAEAQRVVDDALRKEPANETSET